MMNREDATDLLWENLQGLEVALREGNDEQAQVHERGYLQCIGEYSSLLPKNSREELNSRYREITNIA